MQIFAVKRQPPNMNASQIRYLYYLGDIVRSTPHLPHFKPVTLTSVTCCPVPRMTKARDGCRFYVEVHCPDKLVLSTIQEYEKMRYLPIYSSDIRTFRIKCYFDYFLYQALSC